MSGTLSHDDAGVRMPGENLRLLVVLPVYNEQESIRRVINEWSLELRNILEDFKILVIDDGSTDGTLDVVKSLQAEWGANMEWISRTNRGHGQSCLQGYRIAMERGIPHVLQIDSDGQCDPQYFRKFWELRDHYEVIYGKRTREDGFRRIVASFVLRMSLLLFFRVNCVDANVPYRLMNTRRCAPGFEAIPPRIFLANVALAVVLRGMPDLRQGTVPIRFRERFGGEPSVPFAKFAFRAFELFRQLRQISR